MFVKKILTKQDKAKVNSAIDKTIDMYQEIFGDDIFLRYN